MPTLPEKGIKTLSDFIGIEGTSWSTGLSVCTLDVAGRRRKGSVFGKPLLFLHLFKYVYGYKKLIILRLL